MLDIKISKPVIFLVGPTASGKTRLSIEIAKSFQSEIISADSRYFYRGMDIGTAKPNSDEMDIIKHHMIDIVEPGETISVAGYKQKVEKIISNLHKDQKIPLVVGGTGQYIHSIINNWSMPHIEPDPILREYLEKYALENGKEKLYSYLEKHDPEAAKFIDFRNLRRTIRAVEVILKTGNKFSELRKSNKSIYSQKIIGILWKREELYKRIDERIDEMIQNGFIEEVQKLINAEFNINTPAMSAIGYREIIYYLRGKCSLDEAIILMKRNTRQYVRRQANWFKEDDPSIKWFDGKNLNTDKVLDYLKSDVGWIQP